MQKLDYFHAVRVFAQDILDDALHDARTEGAITEALDELELEAYDRVSEQIEGSEWLIYTRRLLEIYGLSRNFPEDMEEFGGMGGFETFTDALMAGCSVAMHSDVLAKLREFTKIKRSHWQLILASPEA